MVLIVLLGRDVFELFDVLFKQNPHRRVYFDSDREIFNLE